MPDPQQLRDEFAAAFEAGEEPNPTDFAERADDPGARQETEALIDRYLMTAPRRKWDPVAYEQSLARVAVEQVFDSIEGVSGTWPEVLPALRKRARIKRRDLVERLAEALGFGEQAEVEKVGRYYHEMEHGLLPAEGVSPRVIDALAGIVGSSADVIRRAGEAVTGTGGSAGEVFARKALLDADYVADAGMASPAEPAAAPRQRDEIDELFTAG